MNTSIIQPEKSNKTKLVSDNQNERRETDNIKTEYIDQQSADSQSEKSRNKIDVASPNAKKETSVNEGEQPSGATRTSSRKKRLGEAIPTILHKKEGGCDKS